jgi:hypothetical protein
LELGEFNGGLGLANRSSCPPRGSGEGELQTSGPCSDHFKPSSNPARNATTRQRLPPSAALQSVARMAGSKRITLHVWALPLRAEDVPDPRRAEALAALNRVDKQRKFKLPTHTETAVGDVWPLVEQRYRDYYLDDEDKR